VNCERRRLRAAPLLLEAKREPVRLRLELAVSQFHRLQFEEVSCTM
jgi:hypothetical protein